MNAAAPLLHAQDLRLRLGGRAVLDGVDVTLHAGELLALVGPNGSGKSTLLRVLCGLQPADAGSVEPPCRGSRQRARRVAYLPQHAGEPPPFTVEDVVRMGRAPWQNMFGSASPQDDALVEDSLRRMDMWPLRNQPFAACSGGERQRALLARALCQGTPTLLLDEPTSAQDCGQQLRIMETLAAWRAQRPGLASTAGEDARGGIIAVLHDLNLAALYADRVLLLHEGRVAAQGPPLEIFTQAHLQRIYACNLLVDTHPCTTRPRITLTR